MLCAGLALRLAGWPLPTSLDRLTAALAAVHIPLMLLAGGAQVSTARLARVRMLRDLALALGVWYLVPLALVAITLITVPAIQLDVSVVLAMCMLAPASTALGRTARDLQLNEEFAWGVVEGSRTLSLAVMPLLVFGGALANALPVSMRPVVIALVVLCMLLVMGTVAVGSNAIAKLQLEQGAALRTGTLTNASVQQASSDGERHQAASTAAEEPGGATASAAAANPESQSAGAPEAQTSSRAMGFIVDLDAEESAQPLSADEPLDNDSPSSSQPGQDPDLPPPGASPLPPAQAIGSPCAPWASSQWHPFVKHQRWHGRPNCGLQTVKRPLRHMMASRPAAHSGSQAAHAACNVRL